MVLKDGVYQTCGPTVERLPAGAYSAGVDCYGRPQFTRRRPQLDDLVDFSDSLAGQLLAEIDHFWTLGERFRKYGFLHRRGYLLYGKQGGGKSSLIHLIIDRYVRAGNVAIWCEHPESFNAAASAFRRVEPDRPMLCLFEDIDALIGNYGDYELLQWLDGHHQVDRAVNLATTNYPERLDPRIISRPRRFDRVLRVDSPDARLRAAYLARKLPDLGSAERARWVALTDGLTFAHLAEMAISVLCLGKDLEETVRLLRQLDENRPTSEEFLVLHVNSAEKATAN